MTPLTDHPELLRLAGLLLLDPPRARRILAAADVAQYGVDPDGAAGQVLGALVTASPDGPDASHDTLVRHALALGLRQLADASQAEVERRARRDTDWARYLEIRKLLPRTPDDEREALVTEALALGQLHGFDPGMIGGLVSDLMLEFSNVVREVCRSDDAELRAGAVALYERIDGLLDADDPRRRSLRTLRELVDGDPMITARRDLVAALEDKADRLAPNLSIADLMQAAATTVRQTRGLLADTQRRLDETVRAFDGARVAWLAQRQELQEQADMFRYRCVRYEGWWALPPEQRHPGGPEFTEPVAGAALTLVNPPSRTRVESRLRDLGIEPDPSLHRAVLSLIENLSAARRSVARLEAAAQKRQTTVDRQGNELGQLRAEVEALRAENDRLDHVKAKVVRLTSKDLVELVAGASHRAAVAWVKSDPSGVRLLTGDGEAHGVRGLAAAHEARLGAAITEAVVAALTGVCKQPDTKVVGLDLDVDGMTRAALAGFALPAEMFGERGPVEQGGRVFHNAEEFAAHFSAPPAPKVTMAECRGCDSNGTLDGVTPCYSCGGTGAVEVSPTSDPAVLEMLGLPAPMSPELAAAQVSPELPPARPGTPCPACSGAGGSCGGMCETPSACTVCGGTGALNPDPVAAVVELIRRAAGDGPPVADRLAGRAAETLLETLTPEQHAEVNRILTGGT